MAAALIEVSAAVLVTALVMLGPGVALLAALRAWEPITPLLRPAAAVLATIWMSAAALVATLVLHRSIDTFAALLGAATFVAALVALLRWRPHRGDREGRLARLRAGLPYAPPAAVLVLLAAIDAPQVRSDTFWHVALARRIADLGELTSASIAFEAGTAGNANYPLPAWHALVALADHAPRVDAWSATWFLTLWAAPVAMLAFGAMAAALTGVRRATLVGCWTFVAIVVLGYGPWFFATRYLSYPGQVAIFLLLPLVVTSIVAALERTGIERARQLIVAAAATAAIGVLHGNYVMYPALFAGGAAVLLLLGRRERVGAALLAAGVVVATGAAVLAAQLPWITNDDNFLRGSTAPAGEPSAFVRHRDVFVGSEQSFHVELGSLATQPWLVVGALAVPLLLLLRRRRIGPWVLAGGAVAIVVLARVPQVVELLDRVGSVTPVTRFDRVYPAAIGVTAIALGIGWLLERTFERGRARGIGASIGTFTLLALGSAWADSIRDTRRIVVTPFVEARWVGGLASSGVPRAAVVLATLLVVLVAAWIRLRVRTRGFDQLLQLRPRRPRHLLATLAMVAIVVGLAPATIERLDAAWQPQAYALAKRRDATFVRIEVYPAAARAAAQRLEPGSVVLASFNDTRRIASLAPVQSVEESVLRELMATPPEPGTDAARVLDELVDEWNVDYVAASRFDEGFRPLLDAAAADPERFEPVGAGTLRVFRVRDVD